MWKLFSCPFPHFLLPLRLNVLGLGVAGASFLRATTIGLERTLW